MLVNYLKTAWRNLVRHKGYAFINIFGLALGLALAILIALYVELELSFDRFHTHYNRIHRVEVNYDNKERFLAFSQTPIGPALARDYPEIERYTRFLNMANQVLLYASEEKKYYENSGWWADSQFFQVFSYRFLRGDAESALAEPNSIVLSAVLAAKYFGSENPIGKTIRYENTIDCKVTAVVQDCPANSHIQYGFFISYDSYKAIAGNDYLENWGRIANYTYVILSEKALLPDVNAKIRSLLQPHLPPNIEMPVYLKPLAQIHFSPRVLGEPGPTGDRGRIRFLILIGAAILLLGCINFMNLATARSARRAREVGIRKTVGASRAGLMRQFFSESLVVTLGALVLALIFAQLCLPLFNTLLGRQLAWTWQNIPVLLPWILALTLVIGVVAGSYPALFLSSLQPTATLRSTVGRGHQAVIRKLLVVFQFVISIVLILSTWIIYRQIHYMQNKDLGYNHEQILTTTFRRMDAATISKYETLKNELLNHPAVLTASISRFTPSFNGSSTAIRGWEGSAPTDQLLVNLNLTDEKFLETYGIPLLAGRGFSGVAREDTNHYCLINETTAKRLGWSDPVGKRIGPALIVLGLVKDYHYASLRFGIEPMLLFPMPRTPQASRAYNMLSLKLSGENIKETVTAIKEKYERIFPGDVFEYHFYDESFEWMYRDEMRMAQTVAYFTLLAICISLLGLVGLASFMAEQRTKEIGVRKVLGSSVAGIVLLLSKEFSKWVVLAALIAWPTAYFIMKNWLQSFAYRSEITADVFLLTALLALVLALTTVAYQSIRAALADPVKSLRYE